MTAFPEGTILGYPRIGRRRELKKAVEAFWAGRIDEQELERTSAELRATTRERLASLGLGRTDSAIPESFSYYDQVHDAAVTVGAIPTRFEGLRAEDGTIGLAAYFTIARGEGERAPLEMTKWFDSNYHYLVPEIGPETVFSLSSDRLVREVAEGIAAGFVTRPVIVGPVTLLALAKASDGAPEGFDPLTRLDDLLPVYVELIARLKAAGAEWVQIDEPALVSESLPASVAQLSDAAARALAVLGGATDRPSILVAAPYAELGEVFPVLAAAPVEAIAVDLVRGGVPTAAAGLEGKSLVGGVIDGHNIWRGDLAAAYDKLEALRGLGAAAVAASTSTSLLHVPHDVSEEAKLDARLVSWLAFADQKVEQVVALARGLGQGREAIAAELAEASAALEDRLSAPGVRDGLVRQRELVDADFSRITYEERETAQEALGLPALPTHHDRLVPADRRHPPGARAVRARASSRRRTTRTSCVARSTSVVALQEELGLDVLVHGEPERNDMVQYFAEHLDGFAVTENGWVQSYGSRCVPPVDPLR